MDLSKPINKMNMNSRLLKEVLVEMDIFTHFRESDLVPYIILNDNHITFDLLVDGYIILGDDDFQSLINLSYSHATVTIINEIMHKTTTR